MGIADMTPDEFYAEFGMTFEQAEQVVAEQQQRSMSTWMRVVGTMARNTIEFNASDAFAFQREQVRRNKKLNNELDGVNDD